MLFFYTLLYLKKNYFYLIKNLFFQLLKISCSSFLAIYSFYLILNNQSKLFAYDSEFEKNLYL